MARTAIPSCYGSNIEEKLRFRRNGREETKRPAIRRAESTAEPVLQRSVQGKANQAQTAVAAVGRLSTLPQDGRSRRDPCPDTWGNATGSAPASIAPGGPGTLLARRYAYRTAEAVRFFL